MRSICVTHSPHVASEYAFCVRVHPNLRGARRAILGYIQAVVRRWLVHVMTI